MIGRNLPPDRRLVRDQGERRIVQERDLEQLGEERVLQVPTLRDGGGVRADEKPRDDVRL
jgi:hypothetical protein